MFPDNTSVQRRLATKMKHGAYPSVLGDYPADLPNRILLTKGIAETGKLDSPVIGASGASTNPLQEIIDLLRRMPENLSMEARTRFIVQPRESVSFIASGRVLALTNAAGPTVVTSILVDESFTGFLTHVGLNVVAGPGFPDIIWQVRVNGSIHPKFNNQVFYSSTLSTPLPFALELTQNRTVQLVAINTNAVVNYDVYGILTGWTEFLSTYKQYGSSPQTMLG